METWKNQKGVRTFELKTSTHTHIVELDTIHTENHSITLNKNNQCIAEGFGSKRNGDWDDVNSIEEFVQSLINEGYVETT